MLLAIAQNAVNRIKEAKQYMGMELGGFIIDAVKPLAGLAYRVYSHLDVNGYRIAMIEFFPGPFDAAAGIDSKMTVDVMIWMGWEDVGALGYDTHETPPTQIKLPIGAYKWHSTAFDGPVNWFACFNNLDSAISFAEHARPQPDEQAAWIRQAH